jgi:hypothetical protein
MASKLPDILKSQKIGKRGMQPFLAGPRHYFDRPQRISAKVKEIIVNAYNGNVQYLRPY